MRLEPLYRARFSTPDRWSVQLDGPHGTETQSLLFAQGRCEGQVAVTGVVERRADGHGSDVAIEISTLIWEPAGA